MSTGVWHELGDWQRRQIENYKQECYKQLCSKFPDNTNLIATLLPQDFEDVKHQLVIDCVVQAQEMQSHIPALERVTSSANRKHIFYIPIRFIPSEKITRNDRLLLAYDALVLSIATGKMPPFGKIIYGREQKSVKVQLAGLIRTTRSVIRKITAQQASQTLPPLILNKHCLQCDFQSRCRQLAVEKDELSLLAGITEKERRRQHDKGIFSVTQLSYTFRPRRRPKELSSKPEKPHFALKALAIRERKIHIAGRPEIKISGNPVYLDVESDPDRDFYYLIGLRISTHNFQTQHSFWADEQSEEKEIWTSFLHRLCCMNDYRRRFTPWFAQPIPYVASSTR